MDVDQEGTRHVIYCYTHKMNGKKYVGQTGIKYSWTPMQAIAHRRTSGDGYTRCVLFGRALEKYGLDAFECEVLELVERQAGADAAEDKWILDLNTLHPNGYNLNRGGYGPRHPLTCEKLRARMLAIPPEQRRAMAIARMAAKTPEQKSEAARKAWVSSGPERKESAKLEMQTRPAAMHSAASKKYWASVPADVRSARAKVRCVDHFASTPVAMRQEIGRKNYANKTPEQVSRLHAACAAIPRERRVEACKKANASMSPEARSERANKAWATKRSQGNISAISTALRSETMKRVRAAMTPEQVRERNAKAQHTRKHGADVSPEEADLRIGRRLRRLAKLWAERGFVVKVRAEVSDVTRSKMKKSWARRKFRSAMIVLTSRVEGTSLGYGC